MQASRRAQALEREELELKLNDETLALKTGLRELVAGVLREGDVNDPDRTAFDLMALSRGIADAAVQAGERDFNDLHARLCRAVNGYLGLPA
jgi:hypothetical protein